MPQETGDVMDRIKRMQIKLLRLLWSTGRMVMEFDENYYEVKRCTKEDVMLWPQ